ncbi:MAG: homoserine O-succinyltransferase [Gammaproteobacteria bacterium]|nr:homoserine O-succinyltransferase [Gammaproteobacteria bacterium]
MPLVAHSGLPTFERLRAEGHEVLSAERAQHQDIRELHVGLLNMMPDLALEATERQFLRLLGSSNRIAQFYVHPFTVEGVPREGDSRTHVGRYYKTFEQIRAEGLDALVITGANPIEDDITRETFWPGLLEVMNWAREYVCSTYCSCLATHAAFKVYHGIERTLLPAKQWGVYSHRVTHRNHPMVSNVNTRFDAPHSRLNDVPAEQIESAGMKVLVESGECGVLAAVSPDQFRFVYFQGHPEYDGNSLLKEYKREVNRFIAGDREDYPPFPDNYFDADAAEILDSHERKLRESLDAGEPPPPFPEAELEVRIDNTWSDTGKAIFNNWLGLVYQLTDRERGVPFMRGIDPNDPLGLAGAGRGSSAA